MSLFNFSGDVGKWNPESEHVSVATSYTGSGTGATSADAIEFIEAGTTLICAGPAVITGGSEVNIVPIGLIEQMNMSQNKPLQRIFEIGSKRSFIIPGRVQQGLSMSRVIFDGPSLLQMLMAGEVKHVDDGDSLTGEGFSIPGESTFTTFGGKEFKAQNPGFGNIDLNFASKIFDLPFGLAMYFRNKLNKDVSMVYLEDCKLSSHNFGIHSQSVVLAESVNIEFTNVVPIKPAT